MSLKKIIKPHILENYSLLNAYDEFFSTSENVRPLVTNIVEQFNQIQPDQYRQLKQQIETVFKEQGVTFGIAGNAQHVFPFDIIPRVISSKEWEKIESGLKQRVSALNHFLIDIYHKQQILKDNIIPKELVFSASNYLSQLNNVMPVGGVYIHVAGIDLVRDEKGNFLILEDNLRVPSGVAYTLMNRSVLQQILPAHMFPLSLRSIENYPTMLSSQLRSITNMDENDIAVLLTPGPYNPAYYEHLALAKQMNWPLVTGNDLTVHHNEVYLIKDNKRVRVIYRRIDDTFLDPNEFDKTSLIGVPEIMKAYRAGNVVIANALGNGVADDKAIFAYIPKIIKYYLNEDPILPQVESYLCYDEKQREFVLKNMHKLVLKVVDQSGGKDILIGPQASQLQLENYKEQIKKNPRNFVAQPLIELSTCPTWDGHQMVPKRIDLRPYIVTGKQSWVMPGALTRVALADNSYIVNSCQGGGSKDTWIIDEPSLTQNEKIVPHHHHTMKYIEAAKQNEYSILHETIYHYDNPVELSNHLFHLYPVNDNIQAVVDYKLAVSVNGYGEFFEDVFGNIATFYQIKSPYNNLIIRSEFIIRVRDNPSHESEYLHQRRDVPLVWLPWQSQMMSAYLLPPELPESELSELTDFALNFVKRNNYDLMAVLNDINQTIYRDFKYVPGSTSITTTAYQLYTSRRGVCQDFTNLFICLARLLNIPARYRTGYIYTGNDANNKIQSDGSHAWVEVYLPLIGWYGFDPTNGCVVGKNHIRIACGRQYFDASPTTGTIYKGGGNEVLNFTVKVKLIK